MEMMEKFEMEALKELINNVARMRKAQKEFFAADNKQLKQAALIRSKQLEKVVDAELASLVLKKKQ